MIVYFILHVKNIDSYTVNNLIKNVVDFKKRAKMERNFYLFFF